MKISQLVARMKENGVSLPDVGTGRAGRVIARDLESALGDYFFGLKYADDPVRAAHCKLRRTIIPMKSYRYDKLKEAEQQELMRCGNNWVAEEKYNGWRMVVTYLQDSGFMFWSGNISDVDFLPKDYTEHLLLNAHPLHERHIGLHPAPLLIDAEALCYGEVVTQDGLPAQNTLEAIGAVLGSSPIAARQLQREGAQIELRCFDLLTDTCVIKQTLSKCRRSKLYNFLNCIAHLTLPLHPSTITAISKRRRLQTVWKQGGEGLVLKNDNAAYASGGRLRGVSVKLKRTMSGEIGDDIDAFVTGFINTPEWSKKGLIGGLKLSVYLRETDSIQLVHHIATVTAMSDEMREELTGGSFHEIISDVTPWLAESYLNKVLSIDGQELSSRNRKLMHAKVNWKIGFRKDKSYNECTLELEEIESEKF